MTSGCSCRPKVDPRTWSGANLTRGTVACGHAPHCGSECRFQHSPLPVRYATVQSPFRCVSSPLPSFRPAFFIASLCEAHRVAHGPARRAEVLATGPRIEIALLHCDRLHVIGTMAHFNEAVYVWLQHHNTEPFQAARPCSEVASRQRCRAQLCLCSSCLWIWYLYRVHVLTRAQHPQTVSLRWPATEIQLCLCSSLVDLVLVHVLTRHNTHRRHQHTCRLLQTFEITCFQRVRHLTAPMLPKLHHATPPKPLLSPFVFANAEQNAQASSRTQQSTRSSAQHDGQISNLVLLRPSSMRGHHSLASPCL